MEYQDLKSGINFDDDIKKSSNANLIFLRDKMIENDCNGAVKQINQEMVYRFCNTDWTGIEDKEKQE